MIALTGRILMGVSGVYTVETPTGLLNCHARGAFRNEGITPLPGDIVECFSDENEYVITSVHDRTNEFIRPLAANIDTFIIVIAAEEPLPDFFLVDKLLVMCNSKKITPVICVNKIDKDNGTTLNEVIRQYSETKCKIIGVSTYINIDKNIKAITAMLSDNSAVMFAGQSGVGKSSIINMLYGSKVMESGVLSERIKRGKNTTRHTRLFPVDLFGKKLYIIDTPGFTSFQNEGIIKTELKDYYPEYCELACRCRYSDCRHIHEPECCVKEYVNSGKLSKERYDRYLILLDNLKNNKWE